MAERTGVPAIDEMIEAVIEVGSINRTHYANDVKIDDLHDPDKSSGKCVDISDGFLRFCQERSPLLTCFPYSEFSKDLGFIGDRHGGHTVVQFDVDMEHYYVDWTATQFGSTEVPRCCKLVDGYWKTEW